MTPAPAARFPLILGRDAGVRRLLHYWTLSLALYLVSVTMLWFEVWMGEAPQREVTWLSAASLGGVAVGYGLIRASGVLGLKPALLNNLQCVFAITCIICAYALVGPVRAVTLSILVVVLVFGGFSATPMQMRAWCVYAVSLLGLTMLWKAQTEPARYPWSQEVVHFVIAATMLAAVAYMAEMLSLLRRTLKLRAQELAAALDRIKDMARHDELTQLINRRQMTETLQQELARIRRGQRGGESACVAVIDIDHFKRVNDTLGHAAGDAVLRSFARQAQAAIRRHDTLARWGGEEFLLLLPMTSPQAAADVLERMRRQVHDAVRIDADPSLRVTFSAGVAQAMAGESADAAIERADAAMYRAKREGRDRIVCAPSGEARGDAPQGPPGAGRGR
jgi:diguanylate cyclase (GGDEF)-like protein